MDGLVVECDMGIPGNHPDLYPVIFKPLFPLPGPNSPTTTYLPVKHLTTYPRRLGDHFAIYRTQLISTSDSKSPLDVILKVDLKSNLGFKDLSKEAQLYETTLKPLQGRVVPKFYGHLQTEVTVFYGTRLAKHTITCLVLEYCGEPMPEDFEKDTDVA